VLGDKADVFAGQVLKDDYLLDVALILIIFKGVFCNFYMGLIVLDVLVTLMALVKAIF